MPSALKHPIRIATLAVVLAAVLPYLSTITDYFIQDDFGVVWLFSRRSALHFPYWFVGPWTEDIWGYVPDEIRPFPALSYQIAASFNAGSPVANHVINIALHAINAWLVMWMARLATGMSWPAATLAGVVFAVLPIQSESVAWVTGRVDSLPALFYFASFALFVRWRQQVARSTYVWSVVLFFMALFSKQNTITLAPALVLYDVVMGGVRPRLSWKWLRPYVPYVLLTAGFLLLRFVLFNEVAREGILSAQRVRAFTADVARHLSRLVAGDAYMRTPVLRVVALVIIIAFAAWLIERRRRAGVGPQRLIRSTIYFGPMWIGLGVAPILMAGYYSPRHMYLAAAGWAVMTGILFNVLWNANGQRFLRPLAAAAGGGLVIFYSLQLLDVVRDWHQRAALSQQATLELEREASAVPDGTLIIVGAPASSWGFSVPFASRPPFTKTDLTERVSIVSDSTLYCCPVHVWEDYTRRTVRAWLSRSDHPPVMALFWNGRTRSLTRLSESQEPYLRTLMSLIAQTSDRSALDSSIRTLLNDHVALVAPVRRSDQAPPR